MPSRDMVNAQQTQKNDPRLTLEAMPDFEGSVWWYTNACLRELETQGRIVRDPGPPVSYATGRKRSRTT